MLSEFATNFNKLQEAIMKNKSVEIKYKNFQNQHSERVIKPKSFEMIERETNFYDRLCLKAYCNLRREDRIFAIYRIEKLKIIE